MSQENVEIVRRAAEFWANRDLSRMTEIMDPEVVLDLSRNVFNPDVYRGYEGVRRWAEAVDEMWDEFDAKIEEVIDALVTLSCPLRPENRMGMRVTPVEPVLRPP